MAGVRLYRASAASPTYPKIRVHKVGASGVINNPAIRLHKASAAGSVSVVVTPPASIALVEPGVVSNVTATVSPSGSTTWVWRQLSGPTAQLVGTGATIAIQMPFVLPPGATRATFGVRATVDGTASAEAPFTIDVAGWPGPWAYEGGTSWRGTRVQA